MNHVKGALNDGLFLNEAMKQQEVQSIQAADTSSKFLNQGLWDPFFPEAKTKLFLWSTRSGGRRFVSSSRNEVLIISSTSRVHRDRHCACEFWVRLSGRQQNAKSGTVKIHCFTVDHITVARAVRHRGAKLH